MATQINSYIEANKNRFISELFDLLRIPSISADVKYKEDVLRTAEAIKEKLTEAGTGKAELYSTPGHPVVYAEKIINPLLPTILVYGHYDVQPPDPLNLWTSPPFDPVIREEKIYARGSSDDKGQLYMHIKALEIMTKTNSLLCNVKFMIEGEEEVGSAHLGNFIKANKEKLKADVVMISDTSILANDIPSITVGLRGLSYLEVEVIGPNRDLHSGVYGGAVANPINVLCKMIASLHDKNGRINIPDFYKDVLIVSKKERAEMAKAPFSKRTYIKDLNVAGLSGEKGYSPMEQTSIRPTLDVNGIWGGYTGEGAKTVLPSKAFAKISMRLVPNQNSEKISKLFEKYFKKIAPKEVKIKVTHLHGGEACVTPTDTPAYQAASRAMHETFGKKPIPVRTGGSIPIVALFEKELKIKSVLMGFGLDSDDIHSPNEHFGVFNYLKGIETIPLFFKYYTEMASR